VGDDGKTPDSEAKKDQSPDDVPKVRASSQSKIMWCIDGAVVCDVM
jgi:hypothetical protein